MADRIILFLGVWFVASVPIGMVVGRMIRVVGATPEPVRVMRRPVGTGPQTEYAPRRAA
jgi:hypothetical protein